MQHLSLDQCQTLKSIGFPQDETYFCTGQGIVVPTAEGRFHIDDRWRYACPTLEELIEWLGNLFDGLQYFEPTNRFGAYSSLNLNISGKGSTPLEAVYNLACALNEGK